jgi:2-dehydropantoate 2-reductase
VGAGAIGGYLAACAASAGHAVTLCVRTPIDGLVVESGGTRTDVKATVATEPAGQEPADWMIVATKAQDTAGAAAWLRQLAGPGTAVAVVQNGVEHARLVTPHLPPGTPVLPAIAYIAAERTAPGHVLHRAGTRLAVPRGPLAASLAELLAGSRVVVAQVDDFTTAAWRKLLSNIAANPITALTQQRLHVLDDPDVRRLAGDLLTEAVAVGRAEGACLGPDDVRATLELYREYARQDADGGTSMLYDRLAGRPMEHEHLTGAVVRAGERHGTPTPLNRALLALLRAVDHGLRGDTDA